LEFFGGPPRGASGDAPRIDGWMAELLIYGKKDACVGTTLPGWTWLLQDLLVAVFGELEIPDLLHSGAVCTSWRSAYRTFRGSSVSRLRSSRRVASASSPSDEAMRVHG
jgi:hypothetical protein